MAGHAVLDDVRQGAEADTGHRQAAGHGLQHHQPLGLELRGQHEGVRGGVVKGKIVVRHEPGEGYPVAEAKAVRQLPQVVGGRAAAHHQENGVLRQVLHGHHHGVDVLLERHSAYMQDHLLPIQSVPGTYG
jgi:hypothetical protein